MATMRVTLKAQFNRGSFYWVADVEAESEDEAVVAAENLFLSEIDANQQWSFCDYRIEDAD